MNERANDYVKEWLGAYLDGELSDERRAWVENHLAACPECQKELAELRALTGLLHEAPAPALGLSNEEFTHQVLRHLPGPTHPFARRALHMGLRYAPLGLFGVWAFFQAVILISSGLLLALPLFPQAQGILSFLSVPDALSSGWLGGILSLTGPGDLAIEAVGITWLSPLVLLNIALIALLAVIFLAWLAGLWSYRRLREDRTLID